MTPCEKAQRKHKVVYILPRKIVSKKFQDSRAVEKLVLLVNFPMFTFDILYRVVPQQRFVLGKTMIALFLSELNHRPFNFACFVSLQILMNV